jgi:hypothetical protein
MIVILAIVGKRTDRYRKALSDWVSMFGPCLEDGTDRCSESGKYCRERAEVFHEFSHWGESLG